MFSDSILIVPLVDESRRTHFVTTDQHADIAVGNTDPQLYTNFLKFNQPHDLLGLSMAKQWLEAGIMDHTDAIGENFYLNTVLISNGEKTLSVELKDHAKFQKSEEGSIYELVFRESKMPLMLPPDGKEVGCYIDVQAILHRERGSLTVECELVESFYGFEPIGFTVAGERTNSNRR